MRRVGAGRLRGGPETTGNPRRRAARRTCMYAPPAADTVPQAPLCPWPFPSQEDLPLPLFHRTAARMLAVLSVTLALAACSSSAAAAPGVGESFATRAASVCQTALEAKQAWSAFPVADFDPNEPDPAAFPEVATWLEDEVAPTFEAWLDDLTALGTPPSAQPAWSDVLSAIDTIVQLNADQVRAAKSADTEGFVEDKDGSRRRPVRTGACDDSGRCANLRRRAQVARFLALGDGCGLAARQHATTGAARRHCLLGWPPSAPEWRNGRRSRLKPGGRKAWGFESLLRHQPSR